MYVSRRDVLTIDQHVIAYDRTTLDAIRALGTKVNPNLDNPRTLIPGASYCKKYPFGTVHYILAHLGKVGVSARFDLERSLAVVNGINLSIGDFVLRADDAMTTTLCSRYQENAQSWWTWLSDFSTSSGNIEDLRSYLRGCPCGSGSVLAKKEALGQYFRDTWKCNTSDGGFENVCCADGSLLLDWRNYVEFFWNLLGLDKTRYEDALMATYVRTVGTAVRTEMTPQLAAELLSRGTINGAEVFSYGYVKSSSSFKHFSYTVM